MVGPRGLTVCNLGGTRGTAGIGGHRNGTGTALVVLLVGLGDVFVAEIRAWAPANLVQLGPSSCSSSTRPLSDWVAGISDDDKPPANPAEFAPSSLAEASANLGTSSSRPISSPVSVVSESSANLGTSSSRPISDCIAWI